jgi:RNA polymerase sigma-70 factor (ECF subfamily)
MNSELEQTFLTALEQCQQKLLRICSIYAEDEDDRKDLFQEALINIWQSMPSFQDRSSLSTWMFRVTLNVCMRLHERKSRRRDRFRKLNAIKIEPVHEQESNSEESERLKRLRGCLQKLNGADKAISSLYLEEMSYLEISVITGLTENNVAVRMKRIKTKLLKCINSTK